MLTRETWQQDIQSFEAEWWGDCANTYGEESKQIAYARVMGLDPGTWQGGDHWPIWDFTGLERIVDVGGGPSSMLLKAKLPKGAGIGAVVVDPCPYPDWVRARYTAHGIGTWIMPAEDYLPGCADDQFDLILCYNVLQHTLDPELICKEMARVATEVRLFEWVDLPAHPGHPHELHADLISEWLDSTEGRHVWLDEQYQEVDEHSDSPVRQHGWGGVFR